jgi:hypothetical protein
MKKIVAPKIGKFGFMKSSFKNEAKVIINPNY